MNTQYDARKPMNLKTLCAILASANIKAAMAGKSVPVAAMVLARMEAAAGF